MRAIESGQQSYSITCRPLSLQERECVREGGREGERESGWEGGRSYGVDRCSHVDMDPYTTKVKPKMSSNEETSTRTLSIAAILERERV